MEPTDIICDVSDSVADIAAGELVDGLIVGAPRRVGWFRYYFDEQSWEWSDEVQQLHGYEPGAMPNPTTELVLAHKHPDDRHKVAATIDGITHSRGVFSGRHRIIDALGVERPVVVIGDQFFDDSGAIVGTQGFYVEITPAQKVRQEVVSELVDSIAANRGVIERAKGMLMLVYDLDDAAAFDLLKWMSQNHNVKLRLAAERISAALLAARSSAALDKEVFDRALVTAVDSVDDGAGSTSSK